MKVVGIVAEYNPFHRGHLYQLEQAKRLTGADYVIAIISGDFMQRGIPAIMNKYIRTKMALTGGVDLVLELPFCYSTASAEFFSGAAVSILDKLGVVDYLCFGSECGDTKLLEDIADILLTEPAAYRESLRARLKEGLTYPAARSEALMQYFGDRPEYHTALNCPNNILGIEYIKALKKRGSKIKPCTIKRMGSDYHSTKFNADFSYSSAQSIRTSLFEADSLALIKEQVPDSIYPLFEQEFHKTFPVFRDDLSLLLKYRLLLQKGTGFTAYADVSKALSNRIEKQVDDYTTYSSFCDTLKTKEITHARVSRALLHILLNLSETDFSSYVNQDYADYARILGFRTQSSELLSAIKKKAALTLLSKSADARQLLSPFGLALFEESVNASQIYQSVVSEKFHQQAPNEYTRQIIKY